MISLSDTELEQVMSAAAPLPPKARGGFLQAVAAELEHQPQRGPGAVYRACRDAEKIFRSADFDREQIRLSESGKKCRLKNKSVKRYDDPTLPLARKISLIEPAQHCDRLRGEPRASTHAVISPDAARRPAHISRSRSASIRADRPRPSALAAWRNPSRWQEELMNSKPEISVEPILKSLEEEISNSVRGDRLTDRLAGLKPQPDVVGDVNQSIGELIDKVSATSIAELEKLISDLQAVRNYLKAEGDRIQQEMTRYAHLSDTASASVKIVAEKLGQWRKGPTMIKTDSVSLEAKHGNSHDL